MSQPLLRVTGIAKLYPGVQALDDVSFDLDAGEIHGLLGENGAGKSTLLKILSGAERPDAGRIEVAGEQRILATPQDAQALGIATIYQELNLLPNLTVAENVFIGREPGGRAFLSWRRLIEQTREVTARIGLAIDPLALVRDLSVAEQQMVEIARALSMDSRVIIMDEPTSALSEAEVETLFAIVRELRDQGLGIIFVTHRLDEVIRLCDRATVLRDGRLVGTRAVADNLSVDDLIRMMVGPLGRGAVHAAGPARNRARGARNRETLPARHEAEPARRRPRSRGSVGAPRRNPRDRRPHGLGPDRARARHLRR